MAHGCPIDLMARRFRRNAVRKLVIDEVPRLLAELAEILSNLEPSKDYTKNHVASFVRELWTAGGDLEQAADAVAELLEQIEEATAETLETAVDRADREYRRQFPWRTETLTTASFYP